MIIGYLSKIKIKDLLVLDLLNDWIPVHEMRNVSHTQTLEPEHAYTGKNTHTHTHTHTHVCTPTQRTLNRYRSC